VNDVDWLATRFEACRPRLRNLAFRMLGSTTEADDALQDAWLRLNRADTTAIADLEGWLVTVVARVCLDELRARKARREDSLPESLPEPIVAGEHGLNPEQAALLGDAVGMAMLVVLDLLDPGQRVSFVLHDVFAIPFDEIAQILNCTPAAARQLASRARRKVRAAPIPDSDLVRQRAIVNAFYAAARAGDFERLLSMLDPRVVLRADLGPLAGGTQVVRGPRAVAEQTLKFAEFTRYARPAVVNGAVGVVASHQGKHYAVAAFTVRNDRIAEIDILADPARLGQLPLADVH
jgi:RNA polymerase sigma-70 factor, ECF subfamily